MLPSMGTPTRAAERFLEALARELDIPDRYYEAAERSYRSVAEWFNRSGGPLVAFAPSVYPQGSFRLGTVIRPLTDEDRFDLDIVCELQRRKSEVTQEQLKQAIGDDLGAYADAHRMERPKSERYCWTLLYSESARYDMDVLPSVPDAADQRLQLEARRLRIDWVQTAVGITDERHPQFRTRSQDWKSSNPRGYGDWFRGRMQVAFDAKRRAMALTEGHGQVERIPDYRVQTPLQSAVQILKRHRDGLFADRPDTKPASIIVSTLAAHAYGSEGTIAGALLSILSRLDAYIDYSTGHPRILNPTDERENFADRWIREPSFKEAFDEWLTAAREDFRSASLIATEDEIADRLADRLGGALVERIAASSASTQRANRIGKALQLILGASHRKEPAWPVVRDGHVQITNVTVARRGFRVSRLGSNAPALAKGCDLKFQADTNVSWPYEVYWQIVNTGRDAAAANDLRGSFENASSERGQLVKKETARYGGTHSIECFIVKNGYCVARSGPFLVNVKA